MKTLDKDLDGFVVECNGAWPEGVGDSVRLGVLATSYFKSEFQQRAKELGFVNGYRWGVEYPTNGKRPDLADDVSVTYRLKSDGSWLKNSFRVDEWHWEETIMSFKITDERYKPADTSYLNSPAKEPVEVDMIAQAKYEFSTSSRAFKDLFQESFDAVIAKMEDDRKQQVKRKAFVDAAVNSAPHLDGVRTIAEALFDAGFKAPEDK